MYLFISLYLLHICNLIYKSWKPQMILWQISLTIIQIKMECFNNYQISWNKLYLSSVEIVSALKKILCMEKASCYMCSPSLYVATECLWVVHTDFRNLNRFSWLKIKKWIWTNGYSTGTGCLCTPGREVGWVAPHLTGTVCLTENLGGAKTVSAVLWQQELRFWIKTFAPISQWGLCW